MNGAVGTDACVVADANVRANRDSSIDLNPVTDHRRRMNGCFCSGPRMQALEGFCEGQPRITHHGPSQTTLLSHSLEVVLIRNQNGADMAGF